MCISGDWGAFVLCMIRKFVQDWKLGQKLSEIYLRCVSSVTPA
jgi:hypothetical protein